MELDPEVRKDLRETFDLLVKYDCDDSEFSCILNLWDHENQSFINFCNMFNGIVPSGVWKQMYKYMLEHSKQVLDNTEKGLLFMPVEIAAALPSRRMNEIMNYTVKEAKTELAKVQVQLDSALATIKQMKQEAELNEKRSKQLYSRYEALTENVRALAEHAGYKVHGVFGEAFPEDEADTATAENGECAEYYAD